MDFNAAVQMGGSDDSSPTCVRSLAPTGTRPYMSPEALYTSSLYNEMTDIWSAGICLYFMLAGHLPWVGRRRQTLPIEVARFPIQFPSGLSDEALELLTGLLSRNVADRLMAAGALSM